MEILRISVDGDEIDALHFRIDHVVHRIFSGAADSDDFDSGESFNLWRDVGHGMEVGK